MSRKRTGLRNRYRSGGQSPYSRQNKKRSADLYGEMQNGKVQRQDIIAGHTHMPLRSQQA